MPKALHDALARSADKKGLSGERRKRYIYGGMRSAGWSPSTQKKSKKSQRAYDLSPR